MIASVDSESAAVLFEHNVVAVVVEDTDVVLPLLVAVVAFVVDVAVCSFADERPRVRLHRM